MRSVDGCQFQYDHGLVDVVIDHAPDNLFTTDMCDALATCLEAPPAGAHVLCIRARGPAFCLGRERLATNQTELEAETAALVRFNRAIRTTSLVTVAQVRGDAAGFGVGVAALCDVSIAGPSTRVWFPEVDINLVPSVVLTWLPGMVGRKQAFLLAATGMRIDGRRASEIGLFTEVAATEEGVDELARQWIAAFGRGSHGVHIGIKHFLDAASMLPSSASDELASSQLVLAGLRKMVKDDTNTKSSC